VAHLATILQTFSDEVARQKGTLIIELSTAVAHNASQHAEIQQRLVTRMGSPVRLIIKEDPALLAGAKIQIGDTVIDSSARQQLRAMKKQLDSVNLS
jgi:F-type H+-transporting ATPase subunit delta